MTAALKTLVLLSLSLSSGCQVVDAAIQVVAPPKVEPVYRLADRPTLLLVEDPQNHLGDPAADNRIAQIATEQLHRRGVVERLVSQAELDPLRRDHGQAFYTMGLVEVGRAVGAEQVVYAEVVEAAVRRPGPEALRPRASLLVRVVDVAAGQRVFPEPGPLQDNDQAYEFRVELDRRDTRRGDAAVVYELRRRLVARVGRDLARLFYPYDPHAYDQRGDPDPTP